MIELFPDQSEVVADVRAAMRRVRRVLLCAATGSGKTVMFCYMAKRIAERGKRVTIGVHRNEIVDQISGTLRRFGVHHGIIASGYAPDARYPVQVASVPTWARRLDTAAVPDVLIADEAHHCTPASLWGKVLARYDAALHLGVTATPERLDGQGLGACFDELVIGPQSHDLIPTGRLCDYRLYAPLTPLDLSGIRSRAGDYSQDQLAEAVDKPRITGDAITEYRKRCDGAPAIARGVSIQHSQHIAEQFTAAGYAALHVDGTTPRLDRRRAVEDFRRGDLRVLSNVDLFSEGFDVPAVVAVLDLRPTQSLTLARQFWGRALRVEPGKSHAIILDHAGNCRRHGLPDDERAWSLTGRDKKHKKRDEDDIAIRQCKACGCVNTADATECRDCGKPFGVKPREVEQVEGELVEVDPAIARQAMRMERAKAKSLDDLRALARARGYKPGWADKVFSARMGRRA